MRRKFYLFVVLLFCMAFAKAAPGDTTWVQAHNDVQLDWNGNFNYDAPVSFPTGAVSYRKVIMVFTLGKYACPAGTQYCGDWDYTVQNYIMTPGGDTVELGRLITPYANSGAPRTPLTWKQRYYFDVTDYVSLLKNSATMRLVYQGYSGGFTGNIKFAFIEGTPARPVKGITKLWDGGFNYGDATNPIENYLQAKTITPPAGTQFAEMKFTVTGHGSDGNYCSEFCSKYYNVLQNGSQLAQKQIWKDNCGENHLYPQSGTWIYDRANWCPGELILPASYKFTAVGASTTSYTADVDFQAYTKSGSGTPSYIVSGYMVHYGAYTHAVDASLEDIIAPTNYEGYFRNNPAGGKPIFKVKNNGANTITSISFQYAIIGFAPQTYTATGLSITPGGEAIVEMPVLSNFHNTPSGTNNKFIATITAVNNVTDGEPLNNSLTTTFTTAPDWPNQFYMRIRTNNYATETSWRIEDMTGTIIKDRYPTAALTFYNDMVGPLAPGIYKLTVNDVGCDGLYWWANASATGLGAIFAQTSDGTAIIPFTNGIPSVVQSGSNLSVPNYSQDFGCGFTQYFRVGAVVPASLLSFSGKAEETSNRLYWETATETNTSHFDIEFGTTGNDWQKVSEVKAKGNSSTKTLYTATHNPGTKAPVFYYRLKMVDADGSFKYSNILTLKPSYQSFGISSIKPNPFIKEVTLNITAVKAEKATVSIVDMQGRKYYTQQFSLQQGNNVITANGLDKLATGVYTVQIEAGGQVLSERLIKQ